MKEGTPRWLGMLGTRSQGSTRTGPRSSSPMQRWWDRSCIKRQCMCSARGHKTGQSRLLGAHAIHTATPQLCYTYSYSTAVLCMQHTSKRCTRKCTFKDAVNSANSEAFSTQQTWREWACKPCIVDSPNFEYFNHCEQTANKAICCRRTFLDA